MTSAVKRQSGFTLLEVLVALAVLAIALAAAIKAVSSHVSNESYLKERSFAHWVAMNKVAELRVSGQWPNAGELNGAATMGGMEFHWVIKVTEFQGGDVRRLDVKVAPQAQPKQPLSSLVAFVGKP